MNRILNLVLYSFFLMCIPLKAQNMASIEAPMGVTFAYGLDYHPKWYTLVKPALAYGFGKDSWAGKWTALQYNFSVEQRYYYNMTKRQTKGKNTLHKSADFISVKPTYSYLHYLNNEMKIDQAIYSFPVAWGLRRTISRLFYFEGGVGISPAYTTIDKSWSASLYIYANIGLKIF